MSDIQTDTGGGDAPETGQDSGGTGDAQPGQSGGQQGHHSQRQPRDDAKRFAKDGKPLGQEQQGQPSSRFKRVVKRHGKDVEEEADLSELWSARDERDRLKHLDKASTERLQRASQLAKDAETAKGVAKAIADKDFSSLRGYFEQNKLNPKEALADLLEAAIQDESISPAERELVQLRAEKAAREEADRRREEDAEVEAFHREVDELRPQVEEVWKHALESTALPKTAKMMEVTSRIFLEAAEAGSRLSPEQVAEFARWELVEVNGGLVNELEPMQLVQHFQPLSQKINTSMSAEDVEKAWPDLFKRVHRLLVSRVRGGGAPSTRGDAAPGTRPSPKPKPNAKDDGRALGDPFLDDLLKR